MAWTFIPKEQDVGILKISASSGNAHGESGKVDVLSDVINNTTLTSRVNQVLANGQDLWQLELTNATDELGNRVSDGTAISFIGGNTNVDFFLTRPLIQGRANVKSA